MGFLKAEIHEQGKHGYLLEVLDLLNDTENVMEPYLLNKAQIALDRTIPYLAEEDEAGWRRELLLNYFLNLELAIYKKQNNKHTKWSVFLEKIEDNGWTVMKELTDELDEYVSTQQDPNNVRSDLTKEKMENFKKSYQEKVLPFIEKLGAVDQFRAKLRLSQRLNLLEKKIPVNEELSFGAWVKQKRQEKEWSLYKLSEECGYSPAYIYRIETGARKNPTPQVVDRIVSALGYDPKNYLSMMFDKDSTSEDGKKMELSDLIQLQNFTIHGKEVTPEQRKSLAKLFHLVNREDILRVPTINELKSVIREYQLSIKKETTKK